MTHQGIFKIALFVFILSYTFSYSFYKRKLIIGNKEKSTYGGLVIYLSICLGLLISLLRFGSFPWKIYLPYTLIFLLGLWDDYKELSPFLKLMFQFLIILLTFFMGFRTEIIYLPQYLNYIITIIWLLVITNAFNFLDIMDGLCIGSVLFVTLTLSIIGFVRFQPTNLLLSLLIFASCLGFFPYNYKKSVAYLGDSGSLSLGYLIGVLTIAFSYAGEDKPLALFTPVVILGLPIFDFIYVTLRRIIQRKSIFKKSPDHLALLMEKGGEPKEKVVFKFWLISSGFVFSSLLLQFGPFILGILALILAVVLFLKLGFKYYR